MTAKCRRDAELKLVHIAGMAKLVDALDLGSSGATHQSSNLCTRTKNHDHVNRLDMCAEMTGSGYPVQISPRILRSSWSRPVKKTSIFSACLVLYP